MNKREFDFFDKAITKMLFGEEITTDNFEMLRLFTLGRRFGRLQERALGKESSNLGEITQIMLIIDSIKEEKPIE